MIGADEMLVFIDESGHPHPHDATLKPSVVAVCLQEGDIRTISSQIYGIKRRLLTNPDIAIKARDLLTRSTFRRRPEKREFVEEFFDLCRNLPLTVFAIVMERPEQLPTSDATWLPNQFRYLLQRVHSLMEGTGEHATILFDGDGSLYGNIARRFEAFLFRSNEGKSFVPIADSPYFVDSRTTIGIQIADMFVAVVRLWEESELYRGSPPGDAFLSAIRRYHGIVKDLTKDTSHDVHGTLQGMYRMPQHAHFPPQQINDSPLTPESQS